jgi:polar amino acid transport system permease protein
MIDYHFDWTVITRNADKFLEALALGLGLAVVSLLIGCVIGLAAAYARVSGRRWLSTPVCWSSLSISACRNSASTFWTRRKASS